MSEPIIVKIKTDTPDASLVLAESGFVKVICDDHSDNDRFEKDDQTFKFAFPIWKMNAAKTKFIGVRVEPA